VKRVFKKMFKVDKKTRILKYYLMDEYIFKKYSNWNKMVPTRKKKLQQKIIFLRIPDRQVQNQEESLTHSVFYEVVKLLNFTSQQQFFHL